MLLKKLSGIQFLFCGVGHQTVYYCEQCEMNIIDEVLNTLSYIRQTRGEILKF